MLTGKLVANTWMKKIKSFKSNTKKLLDDKISIKLMAANRDSWVSIAWRLRALSKSYTGSVQSGKKTTDQQLWSSTFKLLHLTPEK